MIKLINSDFYTFKETENSDGSSFIFIYAYCSKTKLVDLVPSSPCAYLYIDPVITTELYKRHMTTVQKFNMLKELSERREIICGSARANDTKDECERVRYQSCYDLLPEEYKREKPLVILQVYAYTPDFLATKDDEKINTLEERDYVIAAIPLLGYIQKITRNTTHHLYYGVLVSTKDKIFHCTPDGAPYPAFYNKIVYLVFEYCAPFSFNEYICKNNCLIVSSKTTHAGISDEDFEAKIISSRNISYNEMASDLGNVIQHHFSLEAISAPRGFTVQYRTHETFIRKDSHPGLFKLPPPSQSLFPLAVFSEKGQQDLPYVKNADAMENLEAYETKNAVVSI